MTGGWAATNTLRERLQERDGDGKYALAMVETALDAAERVTHSTQDTVHGAVSDLRAALRAVRDGEA